MMRKSTLLVFVIVCQLASAGPADQKRHKLNQWNPLNAEYKIHSGSTAYSELPTKADSVITIVFENEAAHQLFEQIGPDIAPVCDDAKGYRERRRKGALCTYTATLEHPGNPHYRCWVGVNLRSGGGDVRVPC